MSSSSFRAWAWLYRESRPFARYHVLSLICIAASGAAGLVPPLLMKWLIDSVLPSRHWGMLLVVAGLFLAAAVSKSVLAQVGAFANLLGVKHMAQRTHMRLVRHVLSRSATFHARQPVGDLLQRLQQDVAEIREFASARCRRPPAWWWAPAWRPRQVIYLDWRLAMVVLLLLPIFALLRHRYREVLESSARTVHEAQDRQSSALAEMLAGAVQIQLLGARAPN